MKIIGQGTFGIVVETFKKKNSRKCAIKVLNSDDISITREIDALDNERIYYMFVAKYYGSWIEETSLLEGTWNTEFKELFGSGIPERFLVMELELCQGK